MLDELIVLDVPSPPLLQRLAQNHGARSKVVFWANGSLDPEVIHYWAPRARELVVAGEVAEKVRMIAARPITSLSKYLGANDAWRTPSRQRTEGGDGRPVLFFPTNDTIAKMFIPVARHVAAAAFATPVKWRAEGAFRVLDEAGTPYVENHARLLDETNPSVVLFGNDWSGEEIDLIQRARRRGIPTACLQEGCLDWGDDFGRMEWTDFPIVQGPATLRFLDRRFYFATGNPRFDQLRPLPLPPRPRVMINCNFTYNVHEDARDGWVADAVGACQSANVEFFISQHPRDLTPFPHLTVRRSGPDVIHEHLADCSLLITRFSTIVYEAMLLGRPVIYYNPHGERMVTFKGPSPGLLQASTRAELGDAIGRAIGSGAADAPLRTAFLREHCGSSDGRAAERCARTLGVIGDAATLSTDVRRPHRHLLFPARRALSRVAHAILGDHPHA